MSAGVSRGNDEARRLYADLERVLAGAAGGCRLRALVRNDLAVMAAMEGRFDEARTGWNAALEIDRDRLMARLNRDLVEAEISRSQATEDFDELELRRPRCLPTCEAVRLWGRMRSSEGSVPAKNVRFSRRLGRLRWNPGPRPLP